MDDLANLKKKKKSDGRKHASKIEIWKIRVSRKTPDN